MLAFAGCLQSYLHYLFKILYFRHTQHKLKLKMNQHYIDVCNLVNRNQTSDFYARHFATHFTKEDNIKAEDIRKINIFKILWQGNLISYK